MASGSRRMRRLGLVAMAGWALAAGCTGGAHDPGGAPSATLPPANTIVIPDLNATTTTTTIPVSAALGLGPGEASLSGKVVGVDGPVPNAVVRIERLADASSVIVASVPAVDGSWRVESIVGGSYRVRAFRAPDYAQDAPVEFFLGADEDREMELGVTKYGPDRISAEVVPNPPVSEQGTVLAVQVRSDRVEPTGRQLGVPRQGVSIQIVLDDGLILDSPPQQITDGNGMASWRLRCRAPGAPVVALMINTARTAVNFPGCVAPPVPSTTAPPITLSTATSRPA